MSTELRYNPLFVPGDILEIDFPERSTTCIIRSITCIITGSADAGAVEEVLADHPVKYYHALYFSDTDGFVHCTCREDYLIKHAERTGHLNWNEVTCGGTDVAEVLLENKALKGQLKGMTASRDHWMKMYGLETGGQSNG